MDLHSYKRTDFPPTNRESLTFNVDGSFSRELGRAGLGGFFAIQRVRFCALSQHMWEM